MLIVGNWKMHKTIPEAVALVERLGDLLHRATSSPLPAEIEIVLAPPFTALSAVARAIGTHPFALAAQDVHWEDQGPFTGEVSALMLKDLGCRYVIVGHSERRRHFEETNATAGKKLVAALRHGLKPILCIGETWDQRANGQTEPVLATQLTESLSPVEKDHAAEVVIAYEPVWAIGSGHPATPQQAGETHRHIRTQLMALWGPDAGARVPILYGGSVTPDNIAELLAAPEINGVLVGGACLDPMQFARMAAVCIRP